MSYLVGAPQRYYLAKRPTESLQLPLIDRGDLHEQDDESSTLDDCGPGRVVPLASRQRNCRKCDLGFLKIISEAMATTRTRSPKEAAE